MVLKEMAVKTVYPDWLDLSALKDYSVQED